MADPRVRKHAEILVDYCCSIQPGDRVVIEATTLAEPLLEALVEKVLTRGGHPYLITELPREETIFLKYAEAAQLTTPHVFRKMAYDQFEARIRVHAIADSGALSGIPEEKQALKAQGTSPILKTQMDRGKTKEFKWVTTLFPTEAYAKEAGMSLTDYENFVYSTMHADAESGDPIAHWLNVEKEQQKYIDLFDGKDQVVLKGPNVDLSLSVKGRTFINSAGRNNMPSGEIFTGPIENSVNGWVRYTYPVISSGRVLEDVELKFVDGRVEKATAKKNQDYLLKMLEIDDGARFVGEFAIGLNFEISQFTGNILFDEKIGGSFHMALGAGYPETGSQNHSQIHWDMICDMREDAEIIVDGDLIYKNGKFVD